MRSTNFIYCALLCAWLLPGCGESTATTTSTVPKAVTPYAGSYPFHAVATVGMVADLVRNVGGDRVLVTQLMGAGVDPHLYKPTRDDVAKMINADIVFYSGLMLEGKMTDSMARIAEIKPVFAATDTLDDETLLEPPEFGGHFDPHVWMDVSAWSKATEQVEKALVQFDPPHAAEYHERSAKYRQSLKDLHEYGKRSIASIPPDGRVLITSHDAFNYFGRAYGLTVSGVQGISTESEAGLQQINSLVDMIVRQHIKAVFVESSVSPKNIEALAGGAHSRGQEVRVGGELFSDAMGATGTYEGTYIGMLDHNITTVTRALGGNAPPRGMLNKLAPTQQRH